MKGILSTFLLALWIASWSQPVLEEVGINEEISMLVPNELQRTPPVLQRSTSLALATFNSRDGDIDLGINQAQLRWGASDLSLLSQFYKANILNLYDNVSMHDEGIKEIDGKQFIVFEFTGTFVDEANAFSATKQKSDYTYIMYTVNDSGVLVFRFTAPARTRSYWQRTVREIMGSISFNQKRKKKR